MDYEGTVEAVGIWKSVSLALSVVALTLWTHIAD